MLFLVWLLGAFLVVGAINLYLRYFGLPNVSRTAGSRPLPAGTGVPLRAANAGSVRGWFGRGTGEPVGWVNSSLLWFHQRCSQPPEFVDAWLRSLKIEAERLQQAQSSAAAQTMMSHVMTSQPMQLRFDGVHGPSPEISEVRVDTSTDDSLTIHATVVAREVILQICCLAADTVPLSPHSPTSPTTMAGQNIVNCDARIQWLQGEIKAVVRLSNDETLIQISFVKPPELKLQLRPMRGNTPIDVVSIESLVRGALSGATTNISWLSRPHTGYPGGPAGSGFPSQPLTRPLGADFDAAMHELNLANTQMRPQHSYLTQSIRQKQPPLSAQQQVLAAYEQAHQQPQLMSQQSQLLSQQPQLPSQQLPTSPTQLKTQPGLLIGSKSDVMHSQNVSQSYASRPAGTDQLQGSKNFQRLLVRVIKANGLVDNDWGSCNAYCLVKLDQPAQSFMTNVIRNTVNPLWDEQFVLELDGQTKTIEFEVLDRNKQPENDLLGKAVVLLDEVKRMPSNRQILPLTGRPRSKTQTSGSVTVELVFLNGNENVTAGQSGASQVTGQQGLTQQPTQLNQPMNAQATGHTMTSGQDYKQGHAQTSGRVDATGKPLSAHDLALSRSHPGSPSRAQDSPTLIVTGAEKAHTPLQGSLSTQSYVSDFKAKEKKPSFASQLKKKFAIKKGPRAQSVDRYQTSSLREPSHLKPPGHTDPRYATTDDSYIRYGHTADTKSNTIGSNIKRMFKRDKRSVGREGTPLRQTPQREYIVDESGSYSPGSPGRYDHQRQATPGTPVPPGRKDYDNKTNTDLYSTSVPTKQSHLQAY